MNQLRANSLDISVESELLNDAAYEIDKIVPVKQIMNIREPTNVPASSKLAIVTIPPIPIISIKEQMVNLRLDNLRKCLLLIRHRPVKHSPFIRV